MLSSQPLPVIRVGLHHVSQFVVCLGSFRAAQDGLSLQRVLVMKADADSNPNMLGNNRFSLVTGDEGNRLLKVMNGRTLRAKPGVIPDYAWAYRNILGKILPVFSRLERDNT